MQLLGLVGLVVGLHLKFHGEGIVLVCFQVGDGFAEFFLIVVCLTHEQGSRSAVVRTLDDAVAAAGRHGFKLLQRLIGKLLIASVGGAHGAVAQNAGHLLILI